MNFKCLFGAEVFLWSVTSNLQLLFVSRVNVSRTLDLPFTRQCCFSPFHVSASTTVHGVVLVTSTQLHMCYQCIKELKQEGHNITYGFTHDDTNDLWTSCNPIPSFMQFCPQHDQYQYLGNDNLMLITLLAVKLSK